MRGGCLGRRGGRSQVEFYPRYSTLVMNAGPVPLDLAGPRAVVVDRNDGRTMTVQLIESADAGLCRVGKRQPDRRSR